MSGYNDKNTRSGDRLTVAGFAAVIVVGVFVVCVILILAKSLFPSNEPELTDEVSTATIGETSAPDVAPPPADTSSETKIVDESSAAPVTTSSSSAADSSSTADSSSKEDNAGKTMYLNQTAYVRAAGNENAEAIFSLEAGEPVEVLETNADGYVHIKYYSYDGWIWNEYLTN